MPPKAILFDFDGVIADTGNHHIAAWQRTLAVMGWHIADEVAVRSAEIDDREFLAEFFAERGITEGKIEDWVRRKQVLTVQLLKDAPRLFPGVVDLVRKVQGRVRLAVVSSTWRENIEAVLGAAGLIGLIRFDCRQRRRDGGQAGSRRLSTSHSNGSGSWPGRRSPSKIRPPVLASARAAGIRAIAVGHRRPFGEWVGDATYISGFEPAHGLDCSIWDSEFVNRHHG